MNEQSISGQVGEYLKEAIVQSLGSMTGSDFHVEIDTGTATAEMAEPIIWEQAVSPGAGRLWISAGRDLWTAAGQMTLAAAGIDAVTDDDCESTWQEIVSQIATGFCALVSADLKSEITLGKAEQPDREPPTNATWIIFTASSGESSWQLKAGWSKALTDLWDVAETTVTPVSQFRPADPAHSKTFDLLLDVALPVSVSFGRTTLEIREVLKLTTGSIVELNRFMTEPVEVIVNDCVIARGEVVVVNGNYGVRITQLSSREDRMKTGIAEAPGRLGAAVK